jgi:hypothetical protein
MTRRLFAASGSVKKEIWFIAGAAHNNTYSVAGSIYVTKLQAFFWKCRSIKPPAETSIGKETELKKDR